MIATLKVKYTNVRYLYSKTVSFPFDIGKYSEYKEGRRNVFSVEIFSPNPQLEMHIISKEFDRDFECKIDGHKLILKLYNKEVKIYAENNSVLFKSIYKEN